MLMTVAHEFTSARLTAHTRVQVGMTCSSLPITVEEHRSKYNQNINLLSALCSSSAVLVSDFIPQTQESFIFHLHLLCYWGGQVWPAVPIFSWIHDSWAVTLESVGVSIFTCYPLLTWHTPQDGQPQHIQHPNWPLLQTTRRIEGRGNFSLLTVSS